MRQKKVLPQETLRAPSSKEVIIIVLFQESVKKEVFDTLLRASIFANLWKIDIDSQDIHLVRVRYIGST